MTYWGVPVRAWFATLGLGCFGLVAIALELQHLLRLSPCPLCIFQRLLYVVLAFVGLAGFLLPRLRILWLGVSAALAALGAGVGLYQSWMQAFPELAGECSYSDPSLIERCVDLLGMQWPSLFLATGFCTSREWVLFGLSMANWSAVLFVAIAAGAALMLAGRGRA